MERDSSLIILCKKCKKPFDNGDDLRKRVCPRYHPRKQYEKRRYLNQKFWNYMQGLSMYFQDPIYQFYRLLNDEWVQPNKDARRNLNTEELWI